MKIKTFYTKTMPEALREVKYHFGPDALILSTKEIRRRSGVWGSASGFEVVAAVDDSDTVDILSSSDNSAAIETAPASGPAPEIYSAAGRLGTQSPQRKPAVRKHHRISEAAVINPPHEGVPPFKGRLPANVYNDLLTCGVEPPLAGDLVRRAL